MSKRIFNLVRPRETNGKTFWDRHGILIIDDEKISLRLDSIPTGEWNGWLNAYERDQDNTPPRSPGRGGHRNNRPAPLPTDFNDEIPF